MAAETKDVGNPNDYKFLDPTGNYGNQQGMLQNQQNAIMQGMGQYGSGGNAFDPNAYMNQFLGQQAGLSNIVSGQLAPLQQALNAQAARSANMGSEAAMAALGPGTRNSGAAMAAYGDAYANPFAQAALQAQQQQLGLTGNLWGAALQGNLASQQALQNLYQNNQGLSTGLASGQGMIYQPTYQTTPGAMDYLMQGLGIVAPIAMRKESKE